MKIVTSSTNVRLVPETDQDKKALVEIRNKGIDKCRFEDDWENEGDLKLYLKDHPWDKK